MKLPGKYLRSEVGRYVRALLAVVIAIALTYAISYAVGGRFRGIVLIYLVALMVAAWNGYGPGIASFIVVVFFVPRLFNPNFTAAQINPAAGIIFLLML